MAEQGLNVRVTETSAGRFTFEGTVWGDQINGFGDVDQIFGYGGDDRLFGNGGDDTIDGGNGADTIGGGAGNDTIYGGAGDDRIDGGSGNDTIDGGAGVELIAGGTGNDKITVNGGDWRFDRIDGGSGNDTLNVTGTKIIAFGGSGDDTIKTDLSKDTVLVGGSGSDRFVITSAHPVGSGRIAEFHGGDAIVTTSQFLLSESIAGVTRLTDASIDTLDLTQWPTTGWGTLTVNLTGTMFDDQGVLLANFSGIENVEGSALRDIVNGNGVANEILGLGGNDVINGWGGDDRLYGGQGNDSLDGGQHNDTLHGEVGDDYLIGFSGSDTLNGGDGNDTLFGDSGIDFLNGGAGNDYLHGGSENDVLNGGAGNDTMIGGAGSDRFVFSEAAKVYVAAPLPTNPFGGNTSPLQLVSVTDTINDFDTAGVDQDKLDLSRILNNQANFNNSAQAAINQGYVYFVQHGATGSAGFGTTVMVDLNGGSHTDTANNYAVADLLGVTQQEMRADLLITYQARGDGLLF